MNCNMSNMSNMDYNKLFINKRIKFNKGGSNFQFNDLSNDIINIIFSHLETEDLLSFVTTNTRFFKLIKSIICENIVVYDPGRYRKVECANDKVPELIQHVHFYFCIVSRELLEKLSGNCTLKFSLRLNKYSENTAINRVSCLQHLLRHLYGRSDDPSDHFTVTGTSSDYFASRTEYINDEVDKEVKSLDILYTKEDIKHLDSLRSSLPPITLRLGGDSIYSQFECPDREAGLDENFIRLYSFPGDLGNYNPYTRKHEYHEVYVSNLWRQDHIIAPREFHLEDS